jgi:hypothetical protein
MTKSNAAENQTNIQREDKASLPVTARLKSPEGSGKASDNEPKRRRKSNTHRVTTCESKGYFDAEFIAWDAATVRCKALQILGGAKTAYCNP